MQVRVKPIPAETREATLGKDRGKPKLKLNGEGRVNGELECCSVRIASDRGIAATAEARHYRRYVGDEWQVPNRRLEPRAGSQMI